MASTAEKRSSSIRALRSDLFLGSPEKVFLRDLREQGVGKHILFTAGQRADLFSRLLHPRLEKIRRPTAYRLLFPQPLLLYFRINRALRLPVEPHHVIPGLHSDH